ncbi:MAG: SAM-dependent methyltransferase [Aquabacterium sp.]
MPNALDLGAASPGDLSDVLPLALLQRAARIRHWVVEDAKSARAFLARVSVTTPLSSPLQSLSIVEMPRPPKGSGRAIESSQWARLLEPAALGADIALLSEAGLPAVADPGAALVRAAHEAGILVEALPGPSALLLALAASGLQGQRFMFVGYLPTEGDERVARIRSLEAASRRDGCTQICIETPYRNAALMAALVATLAPDTRLSVSCGLTMDGGFNRCASVAHWRRSPPQWPSRLPAVFCWLA